jgi:quinol monooxygenase YgiN
MVTEIARFTAQPSKEDDLREGLTQAMAVFRRDPACHGIILRRCVEEPNVFLYQIDWESLEHHQAFRASPLFTEYRGHIAGFFQEPVDLRHYETVSDSMSEA